MIKKVLIASAIMLSSFLARADGICYGQFPNLVTGVCWSCMMPITMMGNVKLVSDSGAEDFDDTTFNPVCYCQSPPTAGTPTSFWEMDMMTDVSAVPGCFPLLGGGQIDMGVNSDAYGQIGDSEHPGGNQMRNSFYQVNLYINPALYVLGAILDDTCLDQRGIDIPWVSVADPTHNDDELAGILTPYAFPFGDILAIGAETVDTLAADVGFGIPEIFWSAGAYGHLYPLTGNNAQHISVEQSARLQTTRVLAELHAAGTVWASYGSDAMCSYYPQLIMDKRQYKFTRLFPIPETTKVFGRCCEPIGRSTIFSEINTELPLPGYRDQGYAIFRKRDCCSGATL